MSANGFKRKLTAIVSADVAGYSRLMGEDEEATVRTLTAYRDEFFKSIQQHGGRLIDSPGDNLLAEFASVVDAMRCAVEIQQTFAKKNAPLPEKRKMRFRIGMNLGDVIEEKGRLYGDGVNIAARIEGLADPGGISFSGTVYDQIRHKLPFQYEFKGKQLVKNIQDPVNVYRVLMDSGDFPDPIHAGDRKKTVAILSFAAIVALLMGGLYWWMAIHARSLSGSAPARSDSQHLVAERASIAVLPFKNLSSDSGQAYFSDGMTNDIIIDLSRFSDLLVIASNTVFLYRGKTVNIKKVGQELGVRYILEGSVQKAGDKVRINAQLIDVVDGTHVWAERYVRDYEDIFNLQGEIVRVIVAKLAVKTFHYEQARALRKRPQDLLAYDYLLRGQAFIFQRTRAAYTMARDMFSKAVALDPNYAAAYVGMGEVEYGKVSYGWTEFPDEVLSKAFMYGQKALQLDRSNASAHALISSVYTFQNKPDLAIKEAQRAIELNPNDSGSYNELGWAFLWSGRLDEAISALEMSLRLDSSSARNIWLHLGLAYYLKEDYEKARNTLEQGLIRKPEFTGYYIALAATYARLGQREEAAGAAAAVRRRDPFFEVEAYGTGFRQPAHRQAIATGLREAGLE